nr:AraC family transcriptional regulator [uncultured Clostridium sp.]
MIVLPTESFQDYVTNPQVRRLYLTDVGFFPCAAHHDRERKEGIEEYIFIYCMEGSGVVEINGKGQYMLHENEVFCIPRFCGHHYYACEDNPWSILWVHFKGEDTLFYPLEECRVVSFLSKNATNRMMFLFELLFRVLERNYTLGNFIYMSQVLSLILAETYVREKHDTTFEQNRHVTNVVRYMYNHLQDNLSLKEIAEEFEFSRSYLNVIFQKYTKHAPMDFYFHLKMKEACKLLKSTDLYIYEVAEKLGYKDQYYFSRIFKKMVGISPKEYRESDFIHYEN